MVSKNQKLHSPIGKKAYDNLKAAIFVNNDGIQFIEYEKLEPITLKFNKWKKENSAIIQSFEKPRSSLLWKICMPWTWL